MGQIFELIQSGDYTTLLQITVIALGIFSYLKRPKGCLVTVILCVIGYKLCVYAWFRFIFVACLIIALIRFLFNIFKESYEEDKELMKMAKEEEKQQKKQKEENEKKALEEKLLNDVANGKLDAKGYHSLAERYEYGKGIRQSLKQAEIFYRKAAECGDAKEKREFGKRFEIGDHIARHVDMEEAKRWYDAADEWEKKNKK